MTAPTGALCTITLPLFEGPLDLLLYLVEKQELDIYKINVSSVAEQYLAHLRALRQLDLDLASEFYLMAVRLVSIKARALLPRRSVDPADDVTGATEDPRGELIRELVEYRRCRERAACLSQLGTQQAQLFGPPTRLDDALEAMPHMWMHGQQAPPPLTLLAAYQAAMARARRRGPRVITPDTISMRQRMAQLLRMLRRTGQAALPALSGSLEGRREFVMTFLALLELMRRRRLIVHQPAPFADLNVALTSRPRLEKVAQQ